MQLKDVKTLKYNCMKKTDKEFLFILLIIFLVGLFFIGVIYIHMKITGTF